jgi:predicted nucleic acid-binding protein
MLDLLAQDWREIQPSERLRRTAIRVAKNHPLRSGDTLHLAAALLASGFEPHSVRFLTEDTRLKQAAEREGFVVP